jgi:YVTN family beta-propeller protein
MPKRELLVLDLATLTLMNTINVGSSPRDIAASSDGRYAYVTNYNDDSLSVLDLATLTLTDTIDVGDKPQGMALSSDGQ